MSSTDHDLSMREARDTTAQGEVHRAKRELDVPTILASAGISAIVSALLVAIGVVGIVVVYGNRGDMTTAAQPTVVNLSPQAATAPGAAPAPAAAPASAAAPTAVSAPLEQVAPSGGGVGVGSGSATTQQAPAQTEAAEETADVPVVAPAALSPEQLNTKVNTIMNVGGDRFARGDEIEGGEAALSSVDAVAAFINVAGGAFTYSMAGPVEVNGQNMSATLVMSLAGSGTRSQQLTWIWVGDKWKLSNASVCGIASYAMLPCSV